jgi:signal transduction protein with GAF and PtsI domain
VLVLERLSTVAALAAVSAGVSGVAVADAVSADCAGATILAAAGLPMVASVGGLHAAALPGRGIAVDGDQGQVTVQATSLAESFKKSS